LREKFEDTKEVIRNRNDIPYNGQKKIDKFTNHYAENKLEALIKIAHLVPIR
jgi:hypothetical protein